MKKIHSWEEFNAIDQTKAFFFLKNSTTCPISQTAFEEVSNFAEDHPHIPTYYLNVQESRALSNQLADEFNVKHESPQIFLFQNGKVLYHDSHWKITFDTLSKVAAEQL
ncbi:bacillithiol system redox-active protein YtxJ [Pseudalkalibacillus sp. SCS-8]|uniref:bacillithiol system redox-active protein YtxJ n=1 Tax=Pseudalkalibacillus nanhaiensis TaxID=3115291 RepID=UPI0032DAC599